ncbi:hypothetical protein, partial [Clostridium perfringens]
GNVGDEERVAAALRGKTGHAARPVATSAKLEQDNGDSIRHCDYSEAFQSRTRTPWNASLRAQ